MVYWIVDLRKWFLRIALPGFTIYMMHLSLPKPEHFDRYIAERRKYEPEFCMRLDHPETRISFQKHFIYAEVTLETCAFRNQHVTPFGTSHGVSRWKYYGVMNNFWFERQHF